MIAFLRVLGVFLLALAVVGTFLLRVSPGPFGAALYAFCALSFLPAAACLYAADFMSRRNIPK